MDKNNNDASTELPAPEVLQPHSDAKKADTKEDAAPAGGKKSKQPKLPPKRTTYRPSHKATFIGLAVVVAILVINAIVIMFVIQSQESAENQVDRTEVTLSSESLNELGVSRTPIGDLGTELTVGPDATFNGTVAIGGNATIGGTLTLNGAFSAAEGDFNDLQGGETSLTSLNVNQDTTTSNLNVREELVVAGTSRLQGSVTISQLLTVNNNVNVTGSLAVGGTLSVRNLAVGSLSIDTSLTLGGKIITRGAAPGVSGGNALGSNGTVSISGTDTAGTVAVNIGVGASAGTLANISFNGQYASTPRVVVTAIGRSAGSFYVNRSASGFSIVVPAGLSAGGYAFDYIIVQ